VKRTRRKGGEEKGREREREGMRAENCVCT
jgi:hypothetical protein